MLGVRETVLVGKEAALKTETCSSFRLTLPVEQASSRAGAGCVGWRQLREVVLPLVTQWHAAVCATSPQYHSAVTACACNKPAPVGGCGGGNSILPLHAPSLPAAVVLPEGASAAGQSRE